MKPATSLPEAGKGMGAERLAAITSRLVALATLVILMPLMLLIGAAIVADSGVPVLFRQERIGLHGRRFWMLKFRKFRASVGRDTEPLTVADDSRCTRIGRLLAKTKLDELPQLWNVILGDMAIVGPRPEIPHFEGCFSGSRRQLLSYRPGIFGPSQAVFHCEASLYPPEQPPQRFYREVLFPTKAALDLAYYGQWSVLGDLKWVLRGIFAVCRGERGRIEQHRYACRVGRSMALPVNGSGAEGAGGRAGAAGHAQEEASSVRSAE